LFSSSTSKGNNDYSQISNSKLLVLRLILIEISRFGFSLSEFENFLKLALDRKTMKPRQSKKLPWIVHSILFSEN